MAFQPEQFGKYYLVDKIAIGGMAEIFKAKQFGEGGFEKVLVIKRILAHLSEDEEFIQMFQNEAKISSTLSHSNIIHIYDFGHIHSAYFIAMEFCEGKDLKTIMKKCQEIGRPLPVEYAVYIIHEVCVGLDYAHRKKDGDLELKILHRDISPSNVILSYDEGSVKIADFGIAKAESATYKTKAGVLKGKFEYMSPEQASGLPIDRRSDIFSVGICFYEILTRRRLFKTDSDLKTLELIRNPLIPPPSRLNPQVTEELDRIVMRALARRPEDRYQEAWEMQHDLRNYMRASTPPTSPDLIALSLSNFMREIFEREIQMERERLEIGTRYARQLLAQDAMSEELEYLDEDDQEESWDIPSGASRVTPNGSLSDTQVQLMIGGKERHQSNRSVVAAVMVAAIVVLGGLLWQAVNEAPESSSAVPAESRPRPLDRKNIRTPAQKYDRATLRLKVQPPGGRVLLDGALIGTAGLDPLVFRQLKSGTTVSLQIELEGYEPYEAPLLAQPEGVIDLDVVLTPKAQAATRGIVPRQAPPPAKETTSSGGTAPAESTASTGRLEFFSQPVGARVTVDGRVLCVAPCAMEDGRANATYAIEMSLGGFESFRTRTVYPSSGSIQVSGTLKAIQQGQLTLTIRDGLSAEIFVDGENKGFAPFWRQMPLSAGIHTIRLRNPVAGLERTLTVEIVPGKETRLTGVDLEE